MTEAAIIDAEFAPVLDAAMVGARLSEVPVREIRPSVMASASTAVVPARSSRDEYVELLKSTALSMGKQAVLKILLPQLPAALTKGFVGALLNPLLGFLVGKALEIAIRETEIGAFFLYIDLRTSAQGKAFEAQMRANLEAQKSGDPAKIAQAEKELINAFKAFVKLTN